MRIGDTVTLLSKGIDKSGDRWYRKVKDVERITDI